MLNEIITNKKKVIIYSVVAIIAITLGIILIKSSKSNKSDVANSDTETTDNTFTSIDVDTTKYVDTVDEVTDDIVDQAVKENGDFQVTVTEDENGNKEVTDIDMGYLSTMPADNFDQTDFERDQSIADSYILEGEKYDAVFDYDTSLIEHEDIINMINKLCQDNELYYRAIVWSTPSDDEDDEDNSDEYYYIVELNSDFYVLTYYPGEGTLAWMDTTGTLYKKYDNTYDEEDDWEDYDEDEEDYWEDYDEDEEDYNEPYEDYEDTTYEYEADSIDGEETTDDAE